MMVRNQLISIFLFLCFFWNGLTIKISAKLSEFLSVVPLEIIELYFKSWPLTDAVQMVNLLSSHYYDFYQHYDNIKETKERQIRIWELFNYPKLHTSIFNIRKIIKNPIWSRHFFSSDRTISYHGTFTKEAFNLLNVKIKNNLLPVKLREMMIKDMFNTFPHSIEDTNWQIKFFQGLDSNELENLLAHSILLINPKYIPKLINSCLQDFQPNNIKLMVERFLDATPCELWCALFINLVAGIKLAGSFYTNLMKNFLLYCLEAANRSKRCNFKKWEGIESFMLRKHHDSLSNLAFPTSTLLKYLYYDYFNLKSTSNYQAIVLDLMAQLILDVQKEEDSRTLSEIQPYLE